jgi:hypothetical protein
MGAEVENETPDWSLHFHSQFQVVGADWMLNFSNVGCDHKIQSINSADYVIVLIAFSAFDNGLLSLRVNMADS